MVVDLSGTAFVDSVSINAFITFSGDPGRFAAMGVRVRSRAGDVATASLPLSALRALSRDEGVRCVEVSRRVRACQCSEISSASSGSTEFLAEIGALGARETGAGAVVGIVDTEGLDFRHVDFAPIDDQPRILGLWDQTLAQGGTCGRRPAPWGYGFEFSAHDIYRALHSARPHDHVPHLADVGSHGTHVASVAAGNGPSYRGVAPGAKIIYVNAFGAGRGGLGDLVELAEGVDYVFQRAEALGLPCSVNVSLGDALGPHDGTSPVERFFDNLLDRPGRAITIAAGNTERGRCRHASGQLRAGETTEIVVEAPRAADPGRSESIDIWYPGVDRADVRVRGPVSTGAGDETTPLLADGGAPAAFMLFGTTRVVVTSAVRHPVNGASCIRIDWIQEDPTIPIEPGDWTIELAGKQVIDGRWHAWIDGNDGARFAWRTPDDRSHTMATPATCRRAIAVGAYSLVGPDRGEILDTSGRGPARDGPDKPDLSAPGGGIRGAKAMTSDAHMGKTGTSMAAPQVAGAIALLFEAHGPLLSAGEMKVLLRGAADTRGIRGHDPGHGFGRLRVGPLLRRA